jgi:hypothetical protein
MERAKEKGAISKDGDIFREILTLVMSASAKPASGTRRFSKPDEVPRKRISVSE